MYGITGAGRRADLSRASTFVYRVPGTLQYCTVLVPGRAGYSRVLVLGAMGRVPGAGTRFVYRYRVPVLCILCTQSCKHFVSRPSWQGPPFPRISSSGRAASLTGCAAAAKPTYPASRCHLSVETECPGGDLPLGGSLHHCSQM